MTGGVVWTEELVSECWENKLSCLHMVLNNRWSLYAQIVWAEAYLLLWPSVSESDPGWQALLERTFKEKGGWGDKCFLGFLNPAMVGWICTQLLSDRHWSLGLLCGGLLQRRNGQKLPVGPNGKMCLECMALTGSLSSILTVALYIHCAQTSSSEWMIQIHVHYNKLAFWISMCLEKKWTEKI